MTTPRKPDGKTALDVLCGGKDVPLRPRPRPVRRDPRDRKNWWGWRLLCLAMSAWGRFTGREVREE